MSTNNDKPAAGNQPAMTCLESDDDIRQALEARRARVAAKAAQPKGPPLAQPVVAEEETQPFRPLLRPPMAMLCVFDDSKADGEWFRLRGDRFSIGRADGDLRIPHDAMMSGLHAEIVREKTPAGYRWKLVDLKSTNGTFVRVGSTVLRAGNEILVGRGRYGFEAGGATEVAGPAAGAPRQATVGWANSPVQALLPALVELTPAGPGSRVTLTLPEYWIGRDPKACAIVRPDDPFVSPRHARLFRDAKGQWHVENHKSLNGVWLRVEQIPIESACQLQLGEQRFVLRVLS